MKTPSLTTNAILNTTKTIMGMVFPLITFPYVSRILGAENIGKINYAQSIVSYFALLAGLGIGNYAIREGAKIRQDSENLTRFARQVFTLNLYSSLVSYIAFFVVYFTVPSLNSYHILLLIQCLTIGFTTIGVEWLYSIFEDYLYLSIRTIAVQFISLILMFIFVHKASDYIIYAGILVFSSSAANIWGFIHARKFCDLHPTRKVNPSKHLIPSVTLFANNLAISIYGNAGTTFVGAMLGNVEVGLYSVAMKIYMITKQVLNSLVVVTLPRLSFLSAREEKDYISLLNRIFNSIIASCIPAAILLYALSRPIVLIISGQAYIDAIPMLQIIAFALILASPNAFLTNAILIPLRREKKVVIATASGAAINVILDIILIPNIGTRGACISIIFTELTVFLISLYFSLDKVKTLKLTKTIIHTSMGCTLMLLVDYLLNIYLFIDNSIIDLLVRGIIYITVYCVTLLALRDQNILYFINKLNKKINKHWK